MTSLAGELLERARAAVDDAALRHLSVGRLVPVECRAAWVVLHPLRALRLVTLPEPPLHMHDDWDLIVVIDDGPRAVSEDDDDPEA